VSAPARQNSSSPGPAADQAALAPGSGSGPVKNPIPGQIKGVAAVGSAAANEVAAPTGETGDRNNLISRTVEELYALLSQSHELREDLIAHGVTFHMLNALVELGVHDKLEEQAGMMKTAVAASVTAHGPEAITHEELTSSIAAIVAIDKDTRHVRHVAGQQGVHMLAMNHLTQMMRLNPGDRGKQAVNTFVAYADAAGIKLDQVQPILAKFQEEEKSVLPQIMEDPEPQKRDQLRQLARDVAVGLVLTMVVMWMVL